MHIPGTLQRRLGLGTATALVVGELIGIGIFLTPAGMLKSLGSPMWLLFVWLVMGAMALSGALCYGELAARFPVVGGTYVYLREAYGAPIAFLYGWMTFLVLDPGIAAALAVGMASYVGYAFNLSPTGIKAVAIATLLALALVNMRGVQLGAWLIGWLTSLKVGLLLAIVLWGTGGGLGDWSNFTPFVAQRAGSAPLSEALAAGMVAAFFSFGGWWDASKIAGEVRDPARTLPLALVIGVLTVTLVYILTSAIFLYLVPIERVSSGETFAAQAGEALFGRAGGQMFAGIVIVSVLGSLAAIVMAAPRVYYAMACDGLFLAAAARVHPRFGTPVRAIALQSTLACLLVTLGTFNEIVAYFLFTTIVFIALAVAGVILLRRKQPDRPVAYITLGYPVTPVIFLLFSVVLLAMLAGNNIKQTLLGVAIVLAGVPIYYLIFRRRRIHNS